MSSENVEITPMSKSQTSVPVAVEPETAATHSESSSFVGRIWLIIRLVFVRLRFLLIIAVALVVVANWDTLRRYWQRANRMIPARNVAASVESPDIEYWCPMCPGVLSDHSMKCPVCNMALVTRRRGEMTAAADGSLPRMQLSPYRVQLAGVRTALVEYRPLFYELAGGGFLELLDKRLTLPIKVFDKDVSLLAAGHQVDVSCDNVPRRAAFTGRVREIVSAHQAPTRAIIEIDDPQHELQRGVYASARIQIPLHEVSWLRNSLADERRDCVVIDNVKSALVNSLGALPNFSLDVSLRSSVREILLHRGLVLSVLDSAIIDTGKTKTVYRESGPGMFEAVQVSVGPRCGEFRTVLSGLEAGQRVAAAGAFLLDAEARLNPAVAAAYFGAARPAAPKKSTSDIEQALAGLSVADRVHASKQKTCPVTDKPLGSMGTPYRLEISGKLVFLCCEGCVSDIKANPEKYFSKLPTN